MSIKLLNEARKFLEGINKWLEELDKVECDRKSSPGDWAVATAALKVDLALLQDAAGKALDVGEFLSFASALSLGCEVENTLRAMNGIEDSFDELSNPSLGTPETKSQRSKRQAMIDSLDDDIAALDEACRNIKEILN